MPKPSVLLIEDDRRLRDTIIDLLDLLEIKCVIAGEQMTTRTSLVALKPDLVLLDMPLRARTARRILTDISLDFRLRQTKLVVIATDECASMPECRLADVVLTKPFAIGELEITLRQLLNHGRTPDGMSHSGDSALAASSTQG